MVLEYEKISGLLSIPRSNFPFLDRLSGLATLGQTTIDLGMKSSPSGMKSSPSIFPIPGHSLSSPTEHIFPPAFSKFFKIFIQLALSRFSGPLQIFPWFFPVLSRSLPNFIKMLLSLSTLLPLNTR